MAWWIWILILAVAVPFWQRIAAMPVVTIDGESVAQIKDTFARHPRGVRRAPEGPGQRHRVHAKGMTAVPAIDRPTKRQAFPWFVIGLMVSIPFVVIAVSPSSLALSVVADPRRRRP